MCILEPGFASFHCLAGHPDCHRRHPVPRHGGPGVGFGASVADNPKDRYRLVAIAAPNALVVAECLADTGLWRAR